MMENKIPETDSISALAHFWDHYEITDFEDSLEEVTEPVFEGGKNIKVLLMEDEIESIEKLARKKGLKKSDLIREWIVEKLNAA